MNDNIDGKAQLAEYIGSFSRDPLSFVLACFPWGKGELKNYEGPDEWQKDVLRQVGEGLIDISDVNRIAVSSGNGIGKLHAYDTYIDTPNGIARWGDLKAGDYVFGADGKPTKILQTHHYKTVPMYRVKFDDGSYCEVSSGHLWNVKGRQDRRNNRGWQTLSTLDIIEKGVRRKSGSNPAAKQWEIPIQGAVEFPHREVPLHPYFIGVWIGDGTKGQPQYTKPHKEIRDNLRELGFSYNVRSDENTVYIRDIKPKFTDELFSKGSHERYIPYEYKYNDVENRKWLLRGLLDTDGEINSHSSIVYSTTSIKLAHDVMWLVRSLGGKCRLQPTNKKGWYNKDGHKVMCRECYRLTMTLPFNPFSVKHRKERYKENIQHRYKARYISTIESIGNADGMCITVENADGLYLANDFIVTHNSALVSWIVLWSISTFEDTRGIVTANTETQLRTKTWPEVTKWHRLFIGKELFNIAAMSIFSTQKEHEKTWRIDAIPWSRENPEAFAGLHNQGKRTLVIFDEASAIDDEIWRTVTGAIMDANTEIIWCAFGNPTRPNGYFYECFNRFSHRWKNRQIDSRTVKISNKKELEGWVEDYGIDSDYVRVHVLGQFPVAGENQLISHELAQEALHRTAHAGQYEFAPVIIGVDPAWTGDDKLAVVLRQGIYTKVLELTPKNDNDMDVARRIARYQDTYGASAVFIDMGYGTGIYSGGKDMGRTDWKLVPFGSKSDKSEFANKRAEMWFAMRDWLKEGGCISSDELASELTGPQANINKVGKHKLESKDDMKHRGVASPNLADALALTFAFPVIAGITKKFKLLRQKKKLKKWGAM